MNYIGIDLGTSAVKLLLMEGSGKILKIVSREYPICFPKPGWSEQNPYDWFTQSMDGLKELLDGTDRSLVAGISFGGQMHGLVALDDKDEVIRPAILWNDGRTTKECDYLNQVIGKERLSAYTANISFTGFTAPKVLWMKNNEPENFAKIHKIMLPKDYLAFRLSGNYSTDVSDASGTLFFDCTKWSAYGNRRIFPRCIFRFIQICGKCDSITIYKCHFLMVYFFTLWKSFIPFRYQL